MVLLLSGSGLACAQGTFIYDQQSATNDSLVGYTAISSLQPVGQSFVPTLSSIDFIRLRISFAFGSPPFRTNAAGSVYVNLWSGGISNGVLLAATAPVSISLLFPATVAFTNFYFDAPVALTPGATYYFQPFVQSEVGSLDAGLFSSPFYPATYPGGTAFIFGTAKLSEDLWFREGVIVVPEPSSGRLLFVAASLWLVFAVWKSGGLAIVLMDYVEVQLNKFF